MTMNKELVYSQNVCLLSATYADRRIHKARKVIATEILHCRRWFSVTNCHEERNLCLRF